LREREKRKSERTPGICFSRKVVPFSYLVRIESCSSKRGDSSRDSLRKREYLYSYS